LNRHAQSSQRYLSTDNGYVSHIESDEIDVYIDDYLERRGFVVNDATRSAVRRVLERYRGPIPYRRVDLDRFLRAARA
jgi:hypothetical protein